MREMEDRLATMQAHNKAEQQIAAVAEFETRTTKRIVNNIVQQRFEALKARKEANLNVRRQRLAEKLDMEDAAYKAELLASKKTPEQRRAELAQRARDLATRREAERQQLAATLYDRAFMESCDVLRDANSKRMLYRTLDERNAQIEQKMTLKIAESEEKMYWHSMNEAERQKMEQRHVQDQLREKGRREATLRVLDQQVAQVHERRAGEAAERRAEIAELQELWRQMAREQEQQDAADREKMKALAFELQEFNRIKQMEISEAERAERELDLRILQEALSKEATDEAYETAERERRRDEVRRYRDQLALMMEKEAEETAERDAMILRAQLEQEAKRDGELAARDSARRRLMAEVDALRQIQIAEKTMSRAMAQETKAFERLQMQEEAAMAAEADARKRAADKKSALTRRLELQTQMVAKAHIKAAEEDEKLRALELASTSEHTYMGKVHQTLRSTDPPTWHGRRKFDWNS